MKYLWISLGWISVTLGFLGIFLPLLPTTPFLLLAAFSFSKGSEPLHNWLITHPKLGPPIAHWNEHRAISRTVKIYASVTMAGLLLISVLWGVAHWIILTQAIVLTCISFFLWTQKEPPTQENR
ncbi:MAG: YbaN family protein [Gammaproteobacteria bacterium]|jgi:uncharacterized protein|nr:YbaN family protein [Gammaproteobacteria bacterium]MCH1551789.1 YbaN family protein [Pseudomonadales bacterium]